MSRPSFPYIRNFETDSRNSATLFHTHRARLNATRTYERERERKRGYTRVRVNVDPLSLSLFHFTPHKKERIPSRTRDVSFELAATIASRAYAVASFTNTYARKKCSNGAQRRASRGTRLTEKRLKEAPISNGTFDRVTY